eukprot:2620226-Pleurochrysis_carterae.AAC.3
MRALQSKLRAFIAGAHHLLLACNVIINAERLSAPPPLPPPCPQAPLLFTPALRALRYDPRACACARSCVCA